MRLLIYIMVRYFYSRIDFWKTLIPTLRRCHRLCLPTLLLSLRIFSPHQCARHRFRWLLTIPTGLPCFQLRLQHRLLYLLLRDLQHLWSSLEHRVSFHYVRLSLVWPHVLPTELRHVCRYALVHHPCRLMLTLFCQKHHPHLCVVLDHLPCHRMIRPLGDDD